jgi:hypothetical protein
MRGACQAHYGQKQKSSHRSTPSYVFVRFWFFSSELLDSGSQGSYPFEDVFLDRSCFSDHSTRRVT